MHRYVQRYPGNWAFEVNPSSLIALQHVRSKAFCHNVQHALTLGSHHSNATTSGRQHRRATLTARRSLWYHKAPQSMQDRCILKTSWPFLASRHAIWVDICPIMILLRFNGFANKRMAKNPNLTSTAISLSMKHT